MEIRYYFNILIKRLWMIILIPIVAVSISAYFTIYKSVDMYESNATLMAVNKAIDDTDGEGSDINVNVSNMASYNDILAEQELVKEYKEIIKSRTVTRTVIHELGLKNLTPEGLAGKISVSLKNDTIVSNLHINSISSYTS